ncbi:hypothetical protein D3C81_1125870 [compost metagenome]
MPGEGQGPLLQCAAEEYVLEQRVDLLLAAKAAHAVGETLVPEQREFVPQYLTQGHPELVLENAHGQVTTVAGLEDIVFRHHCRRGDRVVFEATRQPGHVRGPGQNRVMHRDIQMLADTLLAGTYDRYRQR